VTWCLNVFSNHVYRSTISFVQLSMYCNFMHILDTLSTHHVHKVNLSHTYMLTSLLSAFVMKVFNPFSHSIVFSLVWVICQKTRLNNVIAFTSIEHPQQDPRLHNDQQYLLKTKQFKKMFTLLNSTFIQLHSINKCHMH
jgi:hypothetical protein